MRSSDYSKQLKSKKAKERKQNHHESGDGKMIRGLIWCLEVRNFNDWL